MKIKSHISSYLDFFRGIAGMFELTIEILLFIVHHLNLQIDQEVADGRIFREIFAVDQLVVVPEVLHLDLLTSVQLEPRPHSKLMLLEAPGKLDFFKRRFLKLHSVVVDCTEEILQAEGLDCPEDGGERVGGDVFGDGQLNERKTISRDDLVTWFD